MPGIARSTRPLKHATLGLVAAGYAALSFADGGYSEKLIAGATIGIWLVVTIGIVARFWPREPVPRAALVAGGCLAGLVALSALSMIWADDAGRAFFAAVRASGYLALFSLVVLAVPRSGVRAWLLGLVAGLTIVCAAALLSRFAPTLFGNADRPLLLLLPAAAGRLSFPIGYWNGLGACLAIQGVLLAWLGASAVTRLGRASAVALLPLPALALYLTSSRGGFAAAVAGWLVLLALRRERLALIVGTALGGAGGGLLVLFARSRGDFLLGLATPAATHEGLVMGVLTLGCVLLVGVLRYLGDGRLARMRLPRVGWRVVAPILVVGAVVAIVLIHPVSRINEFTSPAGAGVSPGERSLVSSEGNGRYQFWEAALDAYASRPATGIGAGNYGLYWNAHPEVALPVVNAHSLYLETLAELGIVGLVVVLGFFAAPALAGARRGLRKAGGETAAALGVLAAGALSAGLEWTWQLPAAFAPVVAAAALLVASPGGHRAAATGASALARRGQRRLGLAILTVAIAWSSIWAGGVILVSELRLDDSQAAAARGDLAQAADDARGASSVEPWSPEAPLQLALVEELQGDLDAARSAAGRAIDLAPGDWRGWAVAARIDDGRGDRGAAARERARARALTPVPLPAEFAAPRRP